MKKGFTLTEMLVCISIMAVLVVIFLSTTRAKPNSNMVMFRKAYNIASTNIYEMLQSGSYYQSGSLSDLQPTSQLVEGEKPAGLVKFCKVFASYINTTDEPNCNKGGSEPSFTTLDGIAWYLPPKTTSGQFTSSGREKITVDVNGKDNLPNCRESDAGCSNPDIFDIEISATGKMYISGDIAKQYLQNTRRISK